MPAAKGYVQGPDDGTGKKVSCIVTQRSGQDIYTQVVAGILTDIDEDDMILRHTGAGTLQVVPSGAPSVLVPVDCKLARLHVKNTSASQLRTVTVTDGSGLVLVDEELAPGGEFSRDLNVKMLGGVKWGASAAGLTGFAVAYTA